MNSATFFLMQVVLRNLNATRLYNESLWDGRRAVVLDESTDQYCVAKILQGPRIKLNWNRVLIVLNLSDDVRDALLCPICYELIFECHAYTLKCGHRFHKDCIKDWVNSKHGVAAQSCPVCRSNVGLAIQDECIVFAETRDRDPITILWGNISALCQQVGRIGLSCDETPAYVEMLLCLQLSNATLEEETYCKSLLKSQRYQEYIDLLRSFYKRDSEIVKHIYHSDFIESRQTRMTIVYHILCHLLIRNNMMSPIWNHAIRSMFIKK